MDMPQTIRTGWTNPSHALHMFVSVAKFTLNNQGCNLRTVSNCYRPPYRVNDMGSWTRAHRMHDRSRRESTTAGIT